MNERTMHVNDLLKIAVDKGASDLHLKVGSHPMCRVHGDLVPRHRAEAGLRGPRRDGRGDHVRRSISGSSRTSNEVDLAYSVPGLGRFRCNVFQQRSTIGIVIRVIPWKVKTVDELMLPPVFKKIADGRARPRARDRHDRQRQEHDARRDDRLHQRSRPAHVMTIEDPIEYLHRDNLDHQPARNRHRHAVVRLRAAQRAAPGSGRHPGRRNARHGDDRDRAPRRRDRPPRLLDAAHPRRHGNHQPHHLGLPSAPAEADPPPAGHRAQGRHRAAPDAPRRRAGPGARGRSAGRDAVHQGLHRGQGQDALDSRRIAQGVSQYGMQTFDQSIFGLLQSGW